MALLLRYGGAGLVQSPGLLARTGPHRIPAARGGFAPSEMAETNPMPSPASRGVSVLCASLLGLGFTPLLLLYLAELWAKPWYRGWPLAVLGAGLLAGRALRWQPAAAVPGNPRVWLPWLGFGLALLAVATLRWTPWLGACAALVGLVGVVGAGGGWPLTRALSPAYVLLLTVIELPLGGDARLMEGLQTFVLQAADQLLFTFQVPHLLGPNGFELTTRVVPRTELFAGLHGLPAVLIVGLGWLLWWRRHPLRIAVALLAVLLFAVPGEVLRVAWGVKECEAGGVDFFRTVRSDAVTAGAWLLYFLLLLSVDQFTGFLAEPRRRAGESLPVGPEPPAPRSWQAVLGLSRSALGLVRGLAGVAIVLGLLQIGLGWLRLTARGDAEVAAAGLRPDMVLHVPAVGGAWQAIAPTDVIAGVATKAADARVWHWQSGQMTLALGLDGPLTSFADPSAGYVAEGWKLGRATPRVSATNAAPPCVEVELTRTPMLHAVLYYGLLDEAGHWLEPPGAAAPARASGGGNPLSYRVQALAVSARPLTPEERAAARQAFDVGRLTLAGQLTPLRERK